MRHPWLVLFRLPNLPTAFGDALAGAALAISTVGHDVPRRLLAAAAAAGLAELLLYMAGLADNDLVGAKTDDPADRPIPAGALSVRAVRLALVACLGLAALVGAAARLPANWWSLAGLLVLLVALYNRCKESHRIVGLFAMGACRATALLSGVAAVSPIYGCACCIGIEWTMAWPFALLWLLYIAAVTKLGENEERAEGGLGRWRFALGLPTLVPAVFLLVFMVSTFVEGEAPTAGRLLAFLPFPLFFLAAFANWCLAVRPLGRPHDPATRRRAVGRTIAGLLLLQSALLWMPLHPFFFAACALLWLVYFAIRRLAPAISGS